MEEKKLKQRDCFVYLGKAMCGDGNSNTNVCRRIAAGPNVCRKVEGVMRDRRTLRKLKRNRTSANLVCYPGTHVLTNCLAELVSPYFQTEDTINKTH